MIRSRFIVIITILFAALATLGAPTHSAAADTYRIYEYFEGLPENYDGHGDWQGANFNERVITESGTQSLGAPILVVSGDTIENNGTYICIGWKDATGANVSESGTARNVPPFTITSDVSITWIYKKAHTLTIKATTPTSGANKNSLWGGGYNANGQLGYTTANNGTDYLKKIQDSPENEFTVLSVSPYDFVAAIKGDGSLLTWGANDDRQLGDGNTAKVKTPTRVFPNDFFIDVAAGTNATAAIQIDGSLWTWGTKFSDTTSKMPVGQDYDWVAVAAGQDFFMALKKDGSLWSWGDGGNGRLGYKSGFQNFPKRVGTGKWKRVVAGYSYVAGIKDDDSLWLWGYNNEGQLGDGATTDRSEPLQIMIGSKWKDVSCGVYHTLAIREDGTLWAWGFNTYYSLGTGEKSPQLTPKQIGKDRTWRSVAAGRRVSLAIKNDGTLWGWGTGPLSVNSTTSGDTELKNPTMIGADTNWLKIAANHDGLNTGKEFIIGIQSNTSVLLTPHMGTRVLPEGKKYTLTAEGVPTDGAGSYVLSHYSVTGAIEGIGTANQLVIPALTKDTTVTWVNKLPIETVSIDVTMHGDNSEIADEIQNLTELNPKRGQTLIEKGSSITVTAPSTIIRADGSVWRCVGWVGNGDVPITGTNNTVTIPTVTQKSNIFWKYIKQPATAVTLTTTVLSTATSKEQPITNDDAKLIRSIQSNTPGEFIVKDEDWTFSPNDQIKLSAEYSVEKNGKTYYCVGIQVNSGNYTLPISSVNSGTRTEFLMALSNADGSNASWNLDVSVIYKDVTPVFLGKNVEGLTCDPNISGNDANVTLINSNLKIGDVFIVRNNKLYPLQPIPDFKVSCKDNENHYAAIWGEDNLVNVVVGPPVNLQPNNISYELEVAGHYSDSFANSKFTFSTGGSAIFRPEKAGNTLLRFLKKNDTTKTPYFVTVNAVVPISPKTSKSCTVGTSITPPPELTDPEKKAGYVYNVNAYYDATVGTYARDSRDGDIVPVNTNVSGVPEKDMVVAWYSKGVSEAAAEIGWPLTSSLYKYDCKWSDSTAVKKINVPGPGISLKDLNEMAITGTIYNQPDNTLPGFNPNEEHAFIQGGMLYALRTDLNKHTELDKDIITSAGWVLLKYKDTTTQKWAMTPVKVEVESKLDSIPATAGQTLTPPPPLDRLPLSDASKHSDKDTDGNSWYFRDHKNGHWAMASNRAVDTKKSGIKMQWFYPLQSGFYYPLNDKLGNTLKLGDPVPFQNGGKNHEDPPMDITYTVSWPTDVKSLKIGETLTTAKHGLPNVSAMAAVKKIYDEADNYKAVGDPTKSLATLFAPYLERFPTHDELKTVPDGIKTTDLGDRVAFADLPYSLRSRLFYNPTTKKLIFKGLSIEAATGEPLLLPNIMSEMDKIKIKKLSENDSWKQAVDSLFSTSSAPYETDAIGVAKALSAGKADSDGYVVLAENDDVTLGSAPVALHVIKVEGGPYQGEIRVIKSDNPFDEKLTLRHTGDFAGQADNIYFDWYSQPADSIPPLLPASGSVPDNKWIRYKQGKGLNEVTIEGTGLLTLEDNYFMVRYYYGDDPATAVIDSVYPSLAEKIIQPSTAQSIDLVTNNWSAWAGAPGNTHAQLAEGWIKRVTNALNPLDARVADFRNNATNTAVSMVSQAGERYSGAIALNGAADNLNSIGLIGAYQTVLDRGASFSINSSLHETSSATNTALLNAATRIADFYTLLGNEAYDDAQDPTVGYDTRSGQSGSMDSASMFAFQNQVDSPLEEELALLRGRDNTTSTVRAAPFYNRLPWNFTNGDGETAYVQTYNISDRNLDGFINEDDAKIMYPQGHGDAWGHYLTAMTTWYGLLINENYSWEPRPESILIGNSPISVDYLDERKFARTAAYKAHTGAEIVDLTYRKMYVHDPASHYQGYKDSVMVNVKVANPKSVVPNGIMDASVARAWGVDEWARRAGQGAYFDWVTANALLPAVDMVNSGIQKIDRTTVPELKEISSNFLRIQYTVDQSNSGYNPLGLAAGVVPFDIDPNQLVSIAGREPQSHFEQIYGRSVKALENARTAYDYATKYSQNLRSNEDSLDTFRKQVVNQERSYNNQLIEVFGYPYSGDIGAGKTYPSSYDGPDLFHYNYMNVPELTGIENGAPTVTSKVTFTLNGDDQILFKEGGMTAETHTLDVSYPLSHEMPWHFNISEGWGNRRAPGEIQMALQDLIRTQALYEKSLETYAITLNEIEVKTKLLEAVYGIKKDQIDLKKDSWDTVTSLEVFVLALKEAQKFLEGTADLNEVLGESAVEGIPLNIFDTFSAIRGASELTYKESSHILKASASAVELISQALEFGVKQEERNVELKINKTEAGAEVQEMATELEIKAEEILPMIRDMYAQNSSMQAALDRYYAALAKGVRLMDEREAVRKQTAGDVQDYRYQDMGFRAFRNDALQKYHSIFKLASRYAYLATAAYDYEINMLGSDKASGASFYAEIGRQLSPGAIVNGVPQAGGGGLAGQLAKLNQNFGVYKSQLGFNNPQSETTPFSLRSELFRMRPASDDSWKEQLNKSKFDLATNSYFKRYCRPFSENASQQALVIPFSTEVRPGKNFFGWPLGSSDSSYDTSRFATKIRSVGIWFTGYDKAKLSATPRAYLVPAGSDVLRSPSGNGFLERHWQVVDQKLPVPFPITADEIAFSTYFPVYDSTLSEELGGIRKFSSIRAYNDDTGITGTAAAKLAQMNTDSGLVGRSVWNTQWVLIIPGGFLLDDSEAGLKEFIDNVTDIRLFFQTYSYSGN